MKYPFSDLDDIKRRYDTESIPKYASKFLKRRHKRETSWHNPCEEHYYLNSKCYNVLRTASWNCHNNPDIPNSHLYRKW